MSKSKRKYTKTGKKNDRKEWLQRFMGFVLPVTESGCWLWMGSTNKQDYGNIRIADKIWLAHRFSFWFFSGVIEEKLQVCHSCDITSCVNPAHLWLGTGKDNIKDLIKKGKYPDRSGSNGGNCKIVPEDAAYIRASNKTEHQLAAEFPISRSQINRIKTGKAWKEKEQESDTGQG